MKTNHSRIEKGLMALIAALWLLPLPLTIYFSWHKGRIPWWTNWIASRTLTGMQEQKAYPPASWKTIRTATYQAGLADKFDDSFAFRELLIRMNNEIDLRLFKACTASSPFEKENNAGIVVGKHGELYEYFYLREYCLIRPDIKALEYTVSEVKQFQDACAKRGIPVVLVIAPGKASTRPEDIPDSWMKRFNPAPRGYDLMVPMLQKAGVHFVDGPAIVKAAKSQMQLPPFPRAGTHWTEEAALPVVNTAIDSLRSQGMNLQNIDPAGLARDDNSFEMEHDLEKVVNVMTPWRYPVLRLKPKALIANPSYNAVTVGGSFMWNIVGALANSNQFSELDSFYYFRLAKYCYLFDESWEMEKIGDRSIDFASEVYAANCIILEINEEQIPGSSSISRFLPEALAHLPADGARVPFKTDKYFGYQWGDEIPFGLSDPKCIRRASLSGFAASEPGFTWTSKPDAEVRLIAPPPKGDMTLEVKAGTLMKRGQTQHVNVYVNDRQVGSWTFTAPAPAARTVTVPAAVLGEDGKITVRFHVDHVLTAADVIGNDDFRELGINIVGMRFTPASGY